MLLKVNINNQITFANTARPVGRPRPERVLRCRRSGPRLYDAGVWCEVLTAHSLSFDAGHIKMVRLLLLICCRLTFSTKGLLQ